MGRTTGGAYGFLLGLNLESLVPLFFDHRIADVGEAALALEPYHLRIQLRCIHWFANVHGHSLLDGIGQLRTGADDLDKLRDGCCFLPGLPISQILLPFGFAYRESRETLAFEAAASYPAFMIACGGAVIQSVVLLQRHCYKKVGLLHGAEFVRSDHDGDGLTQYRETGESRRRTEWLGFQMDSNDNVGAHLFATSIGMLLSNPPSA